MKIFLSKYLNKNTRRQLILNTVKWFIKIFNSRGALIYQFSSTFLMDFNHNSVSSTFQMVNELLSGLPYNFALWTSKSRVKMIWIWVFIFIFLVFDFILVLLHIQRSVCHWLNSFQCQKTVYKIAFLYDGLHENSRHNYSISFYAF